MSGIWLSITDYSEYRKVSVSTIRRYIKKNQVKHKREKGKYFIFIDEENYQKRKEQKDKDHIKLKIDLKELKEKVRNLEEENNDLKMLVQLYESKKRESPPPFPPGP